MEIASFNPKEINSAGISSVNISFDENLKEFVGSAANENGSIAPTDVTMDLNIYLEEEIERKNKTIEVGIVTSKETISPTTATILALELIGENALKSGASTVNTAVGLIQGLAEFGEALVDTCAILVGFFSSEYTLIGDIFSLLGSKIFGYEFHSSTLALWSGIMDFVTPKHVTDAFDDFHQNNVIGKTLDEYSYGLFKSTGAIYKVADGVGYIGGIILLSLATAGIGGAATGATSAAGGATASTVATLNIGQVATVEITKQSLINAGVATFAGLGKNTQEAWGDGAGLIEGLGYGGAKAMWEGGEMFLGSAINNLKFPLLEGLKGQLFTTGSHVVLDSFDSASSSFVDPLMQMIYAPNKENIAQIMHLVNYDKDGNQISNKTWDDLTTTEKYDALFQYNGGWAGVGTNAIMGGTISFLTEIPDIKKSLSKKTLRTKINLDPNEDLDLLARPTLVDSIPDLSASTLKGTYIPDSTKQIMPTDVFDILMELELYYKTELTTFEEGYNILTTPRNSGIRFTEEYIFSLVQSKTGLDTDEILPIYSTIKKEIENISYDERILGKTAATLSSGQTKSAIDSSISNIEQLQMTSAYVLEKYKIQLQSLSDKFNIPVSEVKLILDKKIQDLVASSDFATRQSLSTLEIILDTDGYIKSQFETGTSGGALNTSWRKFIESRILKVGSETDAIDRPIYGMCIPDIDTTDPTMLSKYITRGPGNWYGEGDGCILVFDKNKVIDSATVTIGDSLDYESKLVGTPAKSPKFNGAYEGFIDYISTIEELEEAPLEEIFSASDQYLEIQFHGQSTHSIANIKEVIFTNKKPSEELIKKLEDRGIQWRIIGA